MWIAVKDIHNNKDYIKSINKITKKVLYFLDTLNIEHSEFIIRDYSEGYVRHPVKVYKYDKYKFFTAYNDYILDDNGMLKSAYFFKMLYVTVFINIPDKYNNAERLYSMLYRLLNILYNNPTESKIAHNIILTSLPIGVNYDFILRNSEDNRNWNVIYLNKYIKDRIDNNDSFFKSQTMSEITGFLKLFNNSVV